VKAGAAVICVVPLPPPDPPPSSLKTVNGSTIATGSATAMTNTNAAMTLLRARDTDPWFPAVEARKPFGKFRKAI
jgi:hypothetical protein